MIIYWYTRIWFKQDYLVYAYFGGVDGDDNRCVLWSVSA